MVGVRVGKVAQNEGRLEGFGKGGRHHTKAGMLVGEEKEQFPPRRVGRTLAALVFRPAPAGRQMNETGSLSLRQTRRLAGVTDFSG